jgi:hypothetical protein
VRSEPIDNIIDNLDNLDVMVFFATHAVRRDYEIACHNLGQQPRKLSPIVIGMRSVR